LVYPLLIWSNFGLSPAISSILYNQNSWRSKTKTLQITRTKSKKKILQVGKSEMTYITGGKTLLTLKKKKQLFSWSTCGIYRIICSWLSTPHAMCFAIALLHCFETPPLVISWMIGEAPSILLNEGVDFRAKIHFCLWEQIYFMKKKNFISKNFILLKFCFSNMHLTRVYISDYIYIQTSMYKINFQIHFFFFLLQILNLNLLYGHTVLKDLSSFMTSKYHTK